MAKKTKKTSLDEKEKLAEELQGVQQRLARALADYQNLERHLQDEMKRQVFLVKKELLEEVIEIYQVVEKLLESKKNSNLELIRSQFEALLKRWQVKKIGLKVGDKFDPHLAECLEVVKGEKEDIIVEVVRPGYTLAGQLLRPALVKVSKKRE